MFAPDVCRKSLPNHRTCSQGRQRLIPQLQRSGPHLLSRDFWRGFLPMVSSPGSFGEGSCPRSPVQGLSDRVLQVIALSVCHILKFGREIPLEPGPLASPDHREQKSARSCAARNYADRILSWIASLLACFWARIENEPKNRIGPPRRTEQKWCQIPAFSSKISRA